MPRSPRYKLTRYTKSEVKFESPAKGDHHCGGCTHFLSKSERCEIVIGHIQAEDWCVKYDPKK
jgi:hypothetical protein